MIWYIIEVYHVFTLNALLFVRIVKSVYVPSFLICQKFSACLEENASVRGNGSASAAAMSEVKKGNFQLSTSLKASRITWKWETT